MGDIVWNALLFIIGWSIRILLWPFGIVYMHWDFFKVVIPYLIMGVIALVLSMWALGLITLVVQAMVFVGSLIFSFLKECYLVVCSLRHRNTSEETYQQAPASPPPDESDPYYILGVDRNISEKELAARYKELIKANHPDKVAQLDPEIQAFAHERSRRIIEAYEAIAAGL